MESNTFIISNDQTSLSERNSKRTYQEIEQLYHFITYYAENVKHRRHVVLQPEITPYLLGKTILQVAIRKDVRDFRL